MQIGAGCPIDGFRPVYLVKYSVRHDARMTAVSVRKRVNEDKAVMKPDGSLFGMVCIMLRSIARVVHQSAQVSFWEDMAALDYVPLAEQTPPASASD